MIQIIKEDGNNKLIYNNGNIILDLNGKKRNIGYITGKKNDWTLVLTRNRKDHMMRVNNSYGICYDLLVHCRQAGIEKLKIVDDIEEFNVPLNYAIDKGKFMHFLKQGFEKQLFIELPDLRIWN